MSARPASCGFDGHHLPMSAGELAPLLSIRGLHRGQYLGFTQGQAAGM